VWLAIQRPELARERVASAHARTITYREISLHTSAWPLLLLTLKNNLHSTTKHLCLCATFYPLPITKQRMASSSSTCSSSFDSSASSRRPWTPATSVDHSNYDQSKERLSQSLPGSLDRSVEGLVLTKKDWSLDKEQYEPWAWKKKRIEQSGMYTDLLVMSHAH
jgi:hypothetical protein